MYQLHIFQATLTDGSKVYNGRLCYVESADKTMYLPADINFVTEKDALQFADGWLNLFLHRTNTAAKVIYNY